jgi:hypothetical protein
MRGETSASSTPRGLMPWCDCTAASAASRSRSTAARSKSSAALAASISCASSSLTAPLRPDRNAVASRTSSA